MKEKTISEIDEVIKINDRPYLEALSALSKDLDLATKSRTEGLSNLVDNVIVSLMGNYTMSIVVFVLAALFISRSITKPISRIISSLQNGLSQVASASNQISQSSQQLSSGETESRRQ